MSCPEIIQTEITAPLEEKVSTVKGVRKILSESRIGASTITLEFEERTNMEFAHLALREKISELRELLPYGVKPNIQPFVPEEFREDPFLEYTISGSYSLQKLREYVKDRIEIGIGSIKGIADVSVTGGSDPEIKIILDKDKLKAFGILPYVIRLRIQERTEIYPAGETPIAGISGQVLQEEIKQLGHKNVYFETDVKKIAPLVGKIAQPEDIILIMGAGDIYQTIPDIVKTLESRG